MPTSSQLAQRVHYSSLVPHQPLIISQHKQKAKKTLAEKAEGKQEHPEVVSDAPSLDLWCAAFLHPASTQRSASQKAYLLQND